MNFPTDAAHVTASFVKSRHGVHQALHMAHDEMHTITANSWDDEIWGAAQDRKDGGERPVLRFLFAKKDHWYVPFTCPLCSAARCSVGTDNRYRVADETRDELMRIRGRLERDGDEAWKPIMEVDDEYGWPHGFCIRHSGQVASKVAGYITDIIGNLELEGP